MLLGLVLEPDSVYFHATSNTGKRGADRLKKYRPKLILTAIDSPLATAWQRHCADLSFVTLHTGSIFDCRADAIVSPANSFGFMDGGIDRLYTKRFGLGLQAELQRLIVALHHGELLVGSAEIVETNDDAFPFMIAAPTMRVPQRLGTSINPYLAARAIFNLAKHGVFRSGPHQGEPIREHIGSLAIPGLGTGVGAVDPVICAKQVRAAIEDVLLERQVFPKSTNQVRKRHDKLMGLKK